jgi:hypothetical protein
MDGVCCGVSAGVGVRADVCGVSSVGSLFLIGESEGADMVISIVIGVAVFGYAAYAGYGWYQKQKQGKCASCAVADNCSQAKE